MLELEDFVHLPQVEPLFDRLVTGGQGLIVVVGWDPMASTLAWTD